MTTTCLSRRRVLALSSLIAPLGVSAQRATKTNGRIGVLWLGEKVSTFGPRSREAFFRESLRQRGWVEGQNLAIDSRFVGDGAHSSREVEGLLAMKVDVIVAMGSPIALLAKNMTSSVPIVFVVFGDPVELRLIERPGRNLTGIYLPTADHAGKRLGLLHDAMLGSTRIAVLKFPNSQAGRESRITEAAAAKLGVELVELLSQKHWCSTRTFSFRRRWSRRWSWMNSRATRNSREIQSGVVATICAPPCHQLTVTADRFLASRLTPRERESSSVRCSPP